MTNHKTMKARVWRGLTSTTAVLLVTATFGTQTAITYTGTLNSYLGTTTSETVNPDGFDASDAVYYSSEFGEFNAENLQTLIAATYDEAVLEEEEGAVLLRNEANALPISSTSRVTLFGHAVAQPVYSPGGANSSADEGDYVIDLKTALENAGMAVNDTLFQAYASSSTARVASNNLQIAGGPNGGDYGVPPVLGEEPSSFYTDNLKASWADDYNDVAIVMLAREGGEGVEMMMEDPEGISALSLHQDEKDLLQMIKDSGAFDKVIVLLNSNYQMEVEWLDDYDVDACLWIGTPGNRGFEGVANLLTGAANPSGRLVDTYAADSMSSPAAHTTSQNATTWTNLDEVMSSGIVTDDQDNVSHVVVQAEGIYVGYKYYETRYEDAVLNPSSGASSSVGSSFNGGWDYAAEVSYPFGYGLSYTTFDQTLDGVSYDADTDTFTATVTVTNTGKAAGKSVAQIYAQTPYGDYEKDNLVEKSAVQVVGFDKTDELAPGASETLTIDIDRYLMASYDYTNAKGYILSEGDYYLALGDDAHDALNNILAAKGAEELVDQDGNAVTGDAGKTYQWNYDTIDTETYRYSDTGEEVTNQFEDADLNYWHDGAVTYLTRQDWEGTFPEDPIETSATEEMMVLLQGEIYTKPDDAPSVSDYEQGVNNGLSFTSMSEVAYDDDETWNKYLDQMTVEELTSQIADMFGTTQVTSVGRPAFTEGDGTASVGDNTFPEEYGDSRAVCLYPSTTVAACMWNTDRLQRRGELMGEEALYCKLPLFWAGGGNLHRTPFGGRNGEYFSEDAILTNLMSTAELVAVQSKGVTPGIKHLAGNDQELYREGLVTFFNEQAFREGPLKGFEGVLTNDNTMAVMQSFNRIGVLWSSESSALATQVLRNEWGFKGQVETDGVAGGKYKYHFSSSLTAGTTTYCIDPSGDSAAGILNEITTNDDGYLLGVLRNAVKNYHYMLSRTNLINGMSPDATIKTIMPWWQTSLYALDAILAILTLACAVMCYRNTRRQDGNDTIKVEA